MRLVEVLIWKERRIECRMPFPTGRSVICAWTTESLPMLAAWDSYEHGDCVRCLCVPSRTFPPSAARFSRFGASRDCILLRYLSLRAWLNASSIFFARVVLLRIFLLQLLLIKWTSGEAYHPGPLPRVARRLLSLFYPTITPPQRPGVYTYQRVTYYFIYTSQHNGFEVRGGFANPQTRSNTPCTTGSFHETRTNQPVPNHKCGPTPCTSYTYLLS